VGAALVVIWLFGVTTFVIAVIVYMRALHQQSGQLDVPASPIAPVTAASGLVTFVLILYLVGRDSLRVAVGSALVGTTAAPMIFEVPFALIVMWRMCSPSPPLLYTLLYFLPLLMIAVTSFAMLALSPATHLTRYTLFSLAAMFFVFAIWAIFGFGYPSDPLSAGLNMIGKVLAFVVAGSLFLPDRSKPPAPGASRSPSSVRRGVRGDRRNAGVGPHVEQCWARQDPWPRIDQGVSRARAALDVAGLWASWKQIR
jgi:hypothetical protein